MLSGRQRTQSRMDTKTFPVPDDFFPPVLLSDACVVDYERQMHRIVRNALGEYARHEVQGAHPLYGGPWMPMGSEGGLTAIRQDSRAGLTSSECRIFGRINGDYRNFIDFYYAETSQQLFEWNQFMFGHAVDAAVLKNIHTRTSGKPHEYMGIKWTCLQPSPFAHKRDNCFLEYIVYTKDQRRRDVGVRVTVPLEIAECPDLYRRLKTKRIKTHTISIVRPCEMEVNATQVFMMSENDFAGYSVSTKSFRKMMRTLNDMALYVDSKRISKQGLVSKANWVPKDSRKACTICARPFHAAMRRRHHCRLCGDVFCLRCVTIRDAPSAKGSATKSRVFQVVKAKFCKVCMATMREETDSENAYNSGPSRLSRLPSSDIGSSHDRSLDPKAPVQAKNLDSAGVNSSNPPLSETRKSWWSEPASEWSNSDWSDTESEELSNSRGLADSRGLSDSRGSSVRSSISSSDTVEKMSFVATLDVIDDDVAVLDEKPRRSRLRSQQKQTRCLNQARQQQARLIESRQKHPRELQSESQPEPAMLEVSEVIDTMDMVPDSELRRQGRAASHVQGFRSHYGTESIAADSRRRSNCRMSRRAASATRKAPSRSISQCLAEQEELLRCMLNASGVANSGVNSAPGMRSKRRSSRHKSNVNLAATMPTKRATVRLYEI